jgi:hypothetical protein
MANKVHTNIPLNLQSALLEHLRKKRLKNHKLPQIGVYYPTTLGLGCIRGQYNFYKMSIEQHAFPDSFLLATSEGIVWHDMLENLNVWDSIEGSAKMKIPLDSGGHITIRGRYDAIRGDTVYDFKKTNRVPWGYKPKFNHLMQLNFYMECLGKPKGVIAYIGYSGRDFVIKEYHHVLTDWLTQTLINKALTLHTHLVNDVPPNCTCRNKMHEVEWLNYMQTKVAEKKKK